MVNSQIVTAEADITGTSRVVTRKLNQVVRNPPSMASTGLKYNKRAHIDKKKKRPKFNKALQYKSSINTTLPVHTTVMSGGGQQDEPTLHTSGYGYNADMPQDDTMGPGELHSPTSRTEQMTFTNRDETTVTN